MFLTEFKYLSSKVREREEKRREGRYIVFMLYSTSILHNQNILTNVLYHTRL